MDATSDLFWPGMVFTLLAIIVTAVVLGRNKGLSKSTHQTTAAVEERAGPDPGASSQYHDKHCNETRQQLQSSAKSHKAKDETMKHVKVRIYSALLIVYKSMENYKTIIK